MPEEPTIVLPSPLQKWRRRRKPSSFYLRLHCPKDCSGDIFRKVNARSSTDNVHVHEKKAEKLAKGRRIGGFHLGNFSRVRADVTQCDVGHAYWWEHGIGIGAVSEFSGV